MAAESTMPPGFIENISPSMAAKYRYVEDGEYTQKLNIPTYEWLPVTESPRAIVLAIHGLTLHGRRFRVIARMFASNNVGLVALDMRGFGRCLVDPEHRFSTPTDDKRRVDHAKSYEDIVHLGQMIKEKYPGTKVIAMGESLGCTFCVRLSAEHPELVDAMILSAPAVRVNKKMYFGHGTALRGIGAVFSPSHEISLHSFFEYLVSTRKEVGDEMIDDPLIVKQLSIKALLSTDKFVSQTAAFGRTMPKKLPILILQGSKDSCVSPKKVTELMAAMPASDQTLAWRENYGHLQLETVYMRPKNIDAVMNFLRNHSEENLPELRNFQQQIVDAGATILH
jgi:acylglycerol lipase